MNILYCGDQNIADGVLISVLSILKQVRGPLHIYLLTASLQTAEKIFSPLPSSFAAFLRRKAQKFSPENTVERIDASDLFASQTPKAMMPKETSILGRPSKKPSSQDGTIWTCQIHRISRS